MSLRNQLEYALRNLYAGSVALPTPVQVVDPSGVTLRLELTQLDSMSCAFSELALYVPRLQNSAFDVLQRWAFGLSQRVSYLLEKIESLEFDPANGQVLIRSNPPHSTAVGTHYYEIVLSSTGNGTFVLKRFRSISGQPGRDPVEIQLTHEVLLRLVDDLVGTIPSVP